MGTLSTFKQVAHLLMLSTKNCVTKLSSFGWITEIIRLWSLFWLRLISLAMILNLSSTTRALLRDEQLWRTSPPLWSEPYVAKPWLPSCQIVHLLSTLSQNQTNLSIDSFVTDVQYVVWDEDPTLNSEATQILGRFKFSATVKNFYPQLQGLDFLNAQEKE